MSLVEEVFARKFDGLGQGVRTKGPGPESLDQRAYARDLGLGHGQRSRRPRAVEQSRPQRDNVL